MSGAFGHHVLRSRYRFTAKLELQSPLRLSSGRASEATDAPLMRDRGGRVYVPGSSLRGALRSEVERTLAGLGGRPWGCVLFTESDEGEACPTVSKAQQEALRDLEEADVLAHLEDHLCDVCKLFGSPLYGSRLVIEDCYPEAETLRTMIRDGVGIDRDTGTARENVKFDFEVLETGPRFGLAMQVENLGRVDGQLLDLMLALLREGLHVGGKRSGGLGRVALVKDSLTLTGFGSPQELLDGRAGGAPPLTWERVRKEVGDAQAPAV